jgi:hypothetical protein
MTRTGFPTRLMLLPLAVLAGCPNGDDDPNVPILEPEPAGAPTALADGRLTCLGDNAPDPAVGPVLGLPGWVRTYADPTNSGGVQPAAQVEAFDENGLSIGAAFADTGNGRVSVTVPVRAEGFGGSVLVTATGFIPTRFFTSRPVTGTEAAGWAWLVTEAERDQLAVDAGVVLDPAQGIVVGAIHDCDVFGVGATVIRIGGATGSTDGVVYFDAFAPVPGDTFTAASGRFARANVTPGPVTVEAFGRTEPGGPLELLGRADVNVAVGEITAVDLQPRVGVDR